MTPEEKAVIEAAIALYHGPSQDDASACAVSLAAQALIYSCRQCNAGGHTCPGDGNPIGHAATDCGEHDEPDLNQDAVEEAAELLDSPIWVETTMGNALINDEIRMGSEQATVLRSNRGIWNVDARNYWEPKAWKHEEFRMELQGPTAPPGFQQYPASAICEILCTPERLAVLRIQEGFPGSAPISSHVD